MRRRRWARWVGVGILFGTFLPASPADAQSRKLVGGLTALTGGILMFGAFDHYESCPSGYSRHTSDDLPTQCFYHSTLTGNTDSRKATQEADLVRPGLLWTGAAATGVGLLLLFMPESRVATVDLHVSPGNVRASKSFGW